MRPTGMLSCLLNFLVAPVSVRAVTSEALQIETALFVHCYNNLVEFEYQYQGQIFHITIFLQASANLKLLKSQIHLKFKVIFE